MVLRAELVDIEKLVDTNALVGGHMDVAQQRVSVLIETAEAFQKDLLAARNSANGGGIIAQPASANLQSLIATLNVTMDGQYLFGGINTGVAPIAEYAAGSPSKTAIDAAFLATFGFAQNSPLTSGISEVIRNNLAQLLSGLALSLSARALPYPTGMKAAPRFRRSRSMWRVSFMKRPRSSTCR